VCRLRRVGGPVIVTQAEIAIGAFRAVGQTVRVSRVPSGVVRVVGRLASPLNPNAGANLQMFVLMGQHDMVRKPVGTHHLADHFDRSHDRSVRVRSAAGETDARGW